MRHKPFAAHLRSGVNPDLPYGILDISRSAAGRVPKRGPIRCFVRGCHYLLRPPARETGNGHVCPLHEIYSHRSGTYRYSDPRRNLIASPDFFAQNILRHPGKLETHRFGHENSEDAVTWNVFRSFQNAGLLHELAALTTGLKVSREPQLFLWGIRIERDQVAQETAATLLAARSKMEAKLPVSRPKTEPDIMLFQPGRFLVLIEAKLTSCNGVYVRGPRKKAGDLTLDELLSIYHDPELDLLDAAQVQSRDRIAYQLYRNTVFAAWMARLDGPRTRAYHANLVREGCDEATAAEFHELFRPEFKDRFRRVTWEQIYGIAATHRSSLDRLCRYMETKTASLARAFRITTPPTDGLNV